jgi:hypothetical protein
VVIIACATLQQVDIIRPDHFRGFPVTGPCLMVIHRQIDEWRPAPLASAGGAAAALGDSPIIAEDLGGSRLTIDFARRLNCPACAQFGFGSWQEDSSAAQLRA